MPKTMYGFYFSFHTENFLSIFFSSFDTNYCHHSHSLKKVPLILGISAIAGFIFTRQVLYTPNRRGAIPVERSGGGI